MTLHARHINAQTSGTRFCSHKQAQGPATHAWQAATVDDFNLVARMMRQASVGEDVPIEPEQFGATLSRLMHRGSTSRSGWSVIAGHNGQPSGFALVLIRPGDGPELTWLHVENGEDQIAAVLWQKVLQIKRQWKLPILKVGLFVQIPSSAVVGP